MASIGHASTLTVTLVSDPAPYNQHRQYKVIIQNELRNQIIEYFSEELTFGEAMEVLAAAHMSRSDNLITIPYVREVHKPSDWPNGSR